MSWSLALHNGDLALGGTRLAMVNGTNKLTQDLRCALLEPMGTDDLHPGYGSLIDGGRQPDGTIVDSPLGGLDWPMIALQIRAEINRITADYRSRQLVRARNDQFTYGKPTLDPEEILLNVVNIEMTQIGSTLLIRITLQVGNNKQVAINFPLTDARLVTV